MRLVVQLGFAGSRRLFGEQPARQAEWLAQTEQWLRKRMERLPAELGLGPQHFLCGLSQMAIGGDMIFSRACRSLSLPQRILLPESLEDYFSARDGAGVRDFSEEEVLEARSLLASSHVIHEDVVSHAADRHARFEDVNLEIVRLSDVLVCLRQGEAPGAPGGTLQLLELARRHDKPVLDIQVRVESGTLEFREEWINRERFAIPCVPPELTAPLPPVADPALMMPGVGEFLEPMRSFLSGQSRRKKAFFQRAAWLIIGAHILATACAILALLLHASAWVRWLLGAELLMLLGGVCLHHYVHHAQAVRLWAFSRLVSEISRSVLAAGAVHVQLDYLFALPFPRGLRPLLRTLNVLHLRSSRALAGAAWESRRDEYVRGRLLDAETGQLAFYRNALRSASRWLRLARGSFYLLVLSALLGTLFKLLILCHCLPIGAHAEHAWATTLGALAILLPVLAVGALSLAASFDLDALKHTYADTLEFLEKQHKSLNKAWSEREFTSLVLETEALLLSEATTWASRRTFKGIE